MRFVLLTTLLVSCAPTIPLEGAKCPCVDGWVCCPGLQVCAAAADRCDAIPGPTVTPTQHEVGVNRALPFLTSGENVGWEVEEGESGGTIDVDGTYHAPASPGVYHVIARASSGARRVAVSVRPLKLSLLAGDYGGPSETPVDGVGEAARLSGPFGGVMAGGWYYFIDEAPRSSGVPTLSFTVLRRLDPATRRIETIGGTDSVTDITLPPIYDLRRFVPDHALVLEGLRIFDLDGRTATKSLLVDASQFPLLQRATTLITGDEQALYGYDFLRSVIVRWDRQTMTERVLSGVLDTPGDQDGTPGLLHAVRDMLLDHGTLFIIDQDGASLRSIDVSTGALTTVQRSSVGFARLCPSRHPQVTSPLLIEYDGRVSTGGALAATGCAVETEWTMLATGPASIIRFSINAGVSEVVAGREGGAPGLDDGQGDRARFVFNRSTAMVMHRDLLWFGEPLVRRIRTVSHDGVVTTRFRDIAATSVAVSDTFVYAVTDDGHVQRAPIDGGDWQQLNGPVPNNVILLGVLDDGRVVAMASWQLYVIDPVTFTTSGVALPTAPFTEVPVLDRTGGVLFSAFDGIHRLDLKSLKDTRLAPQPPGYPPDLTRGNLAMSRGRLYAIRADLQVSSFIAEFDPERGTWTRLVGQPLKAAVVPGPVSSALVHRPFSLAVFDNGDVVVPDAAENAMLIIE